MLGLSALTASKKENTADTVTIILNNYNLLIVNYTVRTLPANHLKTYIEIIPSRKINHNHIFTKINTLIT